MADPPLPMNASEPIAADATEPSTMAVDLAATDAQQRRSSSRIASGRLSYAGAMSLREAFSVFDDFDLGPSGAHSYLQQQRQRRRPRPKSLVSASSSSAPPSDADPEATKRKRVRHDDRPRWHTQNYMIVQSLLRAPNHEAPRSEIIKGALELDAQIAKERGLPRVFRGKTPTNSASACLTVNSDKMFVSFKPPGARSTHFRLAYVPGDFGHARNAYLKWLRTLIEHDWPICFGRVKESAAWKSAYVWRPKYELTAEELQKRLDEYETERQAQLAEEEEEERRQQEAAVLGDGLDMKGSSLLQNLGEASTTTGEMPAQESNTEQTVTEAAKTMPSTTEHAIARQDEDVVMTAASEMTALQQNTHEQPVDSLPTQAASMYALQPASAFESTASNTISQQPTDPTTRTARKPPRKYTERELYAFWEGGWAYRNIHLTYNPSLHTMPAVCHPSYAYWSTRKDRHQIRMLSRSHSQRSESDSDQAVATPPPAPIIFSIPAPGQSIDDVVMSFPPVFHIDIKQKLAAAAAASATMTTDASLTASTTEPLNIASDPLATSTAETEAATCELAPQPSILLTTDTASSTEQVDPPSDIAMEDVIIVDTPSPSPPPPPPPPAVDVDSTTELAASDAAETADQASNQPAVQSTADERIITRGEGCITLDDVDATECPASLDDLLYVADSTIPNAGRGLFAVRDIPCWTPLGFYFGVPMTEDEFDATKDRVGLASHYSIMYRRTVLDATDELGQPWTDPAGLANGSMYCPFHFMNEDMKRGNVVFVEGLEVNQVICMTTQRILKDQELFAYYGEEVDRHWNSGGSIDERADGHSESTPVGSGEQTEPTASVTTVAAGQPTMLPISEPPRMKKRDSSHVEVVIEARKPVHATPPSSTH